MNFLLLGYVEDNTVGNGHFTGFNKRQHCAAASATAWSTASAACQLRLNKSSIWEKLSRFEWLVFSKNNYRSCIRQIIQKYKK